MLRPRFARPADEGAIAGIFGFPMPISTGNATPLTGRKTRLETHQDLQHLPGRLLERRIDPPAEKAGPEHDQKQARHDRQRQRHLRPLQEHLAQLVAAPFGASFVAIGETTAAMAMTKSIRYTIRLLATT